MKLVSADLNAYKRLAGTSVNLDARVIAIVGPNEAGKTSLLAALEHVNESGEFDRGEISRGVDASANPEIVSVLFLLEEEDKAAIAHLHGAKESRWYFVKKRADGKLYSGLRPRPTRDLEPRGLLVNSLRRLAGTKWARNEVLNVDESGGETTVASRLEEIVEALSTGEETLPDNDLGDVRELAEVLAAIEGGPASVSQVRSRLTTAIDVESETPPSTQATTILASRRPLFLRFDDDARNLASEYDLASLDLNDPPQALANLAALAKLNLAAVLAAVQAGEYGPKLAMLESANEELERVFSSAWAQSEFSVRLDIDEVLLRVFVSNPGGGYSAIAERSDGLRAFVALIAFTALQAKGAKPILLIDEAESHLHYDAQADLVRVFSRQDAAAQVIYTTHSAGCLPEDLGTSVRVVEPLEGAQRSRFHNSFWTDGEAGFSTLLLGMGASAFAFASTRYAVIVEGGADVILLPTLIKEAASLRELGYQVAPGLAEVSAEAVSRLDLTAARVAYVLDRDMAGRAIRRKLRASGIPPGRILMLGGEGKRDLVIEDVVEAEVYAAAVNAELQRSHGAGIVFPLGGVARYARPAALARWCAQRRLAQPNRTSIAARILDQRGSRDLLSGRGHRLLQKLNTQILSLLRP